MLPECILKNLWLLFQRDTRHALELRPPFAVRNLTNGQLDSTLLILYTEDIPPTMMLTLRSTFQTLSFWQESELIIPSDLSCAQFEKAKKLPWLPLTAC